MREKDHLEDPSVGRKIILKWIFRKWEVAWTRLIWLRTDMWHVLVVVGMNCFVP